MKRHVRLISLDRRSSRLLAVVVVAASLGVAAHTAFAGSMHSAVTSATVRERDFAIAAPHRLAHGKIVLHVHNRGPDAHELIVVRTRTGRLPMRADGLTVDEDRVERSTVAVLEPGAPGSTREVSFDATPGVYVLFCNMSGHYLGGMRSVLVVR